MTSARLDSLFADLKSWLPSLLSRAVEKQAKQTLIAPQGAFPIAEQRELGLQAMRILGFDFDGGRLDISAHPFCGGVPVMCASPPATTKTTCSALCSA